MKIKYSICNLGLSDTTEFSELLRYSASVIHISLMQHENEGCESLNRNEFSPLTDLLWFSPFGGKENTTDWKPNLIFRFVLHPIIRGVWQRLFAEIRTTTTYPLFYIRHLAINGWWKEIDRKTFYQLFEVDEIIYWVRRIVCLFWLKLLSQHRVSPRLVISIDSVKFYDKANRRENSMKIILANICIPAIAQSLTKFLISMLRREHKHLDGSFLRNATENRALQAQWKASETQTLASPLTRRRFLFACCRASPSWCRR